MKDKKHLDEGKQVLAELLIGIIFSFFWIMVAAVFFKEYRWVFMPGIALGAVVAALIALHMYVTVLRALDMEEEKASAYIRKFSVIRMLLVTVLLGISINTAGRYFALGVFLGVLCLKFSAYLQPLTHKYIFEKLIK